MSLQTSKIQSLAADFQSYQKGRRLWEQGRVRLSRDEGFWKGETQLSARVEEEQVQLVISGDQISRYRCTCGEFSEKRGLCPHCVAAAFGYLKQRQAPVSGVRSSFAARQTLRKYESLEWGWALSAQEKPVELEVRLNVQRKIWSAELRVGRMKKYVVRDLMEFARHFEDQAQTEYGRQLTVVHVPEAFRKEDRPILWEVRRIYDSWKQFAGNARGVSPRVPALRQIELDPAGADGILGSLAGRRITVEQDGKERQVTAEMAEPDLGVLIQQYGDGGAVSLEEKVAALPGERFFYVLDQEKLYICGEEFARKAGPFLDALANRAVLEAGRLLLDRKDLAGFCGQVLPVLRPFFRIKAEGLCLEDLTPEPLRTEFYFDAPEMGCVICQVTHRYGERAFNPLRPGIWPAALLRDRRKELEVSLAVQEYFQFKTEDGKLKIQGDEDAVFRLLTEGIPRFSELGEVYETEAFRRYEVRPEPEARMELSFLDGLLKMNLEFSGERPESLTELLQAYEEKRPFAAGKNGVFLDLRKRKLEDRALKEGENRFPAYRAFSLDELAGKTGVRSKAFQEFLQDGEEGNVPVPEELSGVLRDYQKTGYRWMRRLDAMGLSGILADEMGLGKTVQVIALLLSEKKGSGPSLIVCPASLIYNWENECRKFSPRLRTCPVAGTAAERRKKLSGPADIYITSYDLLRRDIEQYRQISWRFLILDEAQFIKNARTQNARCVKKLSARTRFALTGTPIENRLSELWSIFDFLMPGFLYSGKRFRESLELPILKGDQEAAGRLNRMVRPFLLRRLKSQVLCELPEKLESAVYTRLYGEQKKLYQGAAWKLLQTLKEQSEEEYGKDRMWVLAELMRLRQICCSPELCFPGYAGESAKLEACMELLRSAVQEGHKVLVFSQFTTMLAVLKERMRQEDFFCFQLTGDTPKEERVRLAEEFNSLETPAVFLISLKAGGTGLNLTGADVVIHYDPWWNLAAQDQATDRAHRMGQENKVTVFRLIAKDTVEEKILELQEAKRRLAGQVLGEAGIPAFTPSREELLRILEETE